MMVKEPNWIPFEAIGSAYEQELDVNAREPTYRHRPISFSGEKVEEWRPGPAPTGETIAP